MAVAVQTGAFLLCALVSVQLVSAAKFDEKNGRHNITMGHRRFYPNYPLDTLLFYDTPKMSSSWLRVQSDDVCYPPKGSHPARSTITAFNVTDLVPKGEGGLAYITQGGVGFGNLCLHLKTQRGMGYLFDVKIFGYYI